MLRSYRQMSIISMSSIGSDCPTPSKLVTESFDLEMTTTKPKPQENKGDSNQVTSDIEVKLRRSRKKPKRSSVVFADEKPAVESPLSELSRKQEFMSDTNLSDHATVPQSSSVLKQMSFASRSMPTIPALTLSVANGPTCEEQNQGHRMSQPNIGGLESDRRMGKKSRMNQFFKTKRVSKVADDDKQPETLSIDL